LRFNIFLHFRSKNYGIISKKIHLSRAFQRCKKLMPIFQKYLILIVLLKNEICSIFNNSWAISLNITKPSPCTPTHRGLSKSNQESMTNGILKHFHFRMPFVVTTFGPPFWTLVQTSNYHLVLELWGFQGRR
jgi:hypothetical protein